MKKKYNLKDGFYLEVRNHGDNSGIKIRRDSAKQMEEAVKVYGRTKDVVKLGEIKDGVLQEAS